MSAPSCNAPFPLPPSVPEFFHGLMMGGGLIPLELYGHTMREVHGVSQKCFEGLADFDFFGVENRFNDVSMTTGTPLVQFTYDGPMMPATDASENGERKLYGYGGPTSMVHEGIEMFEDMGYEICRDAGGEYVTLDGTVTMDAETSYWFRTFAPAANLLKAPGLYPYGYLHEGSIMYWFTMYTYEYENMCGNFGYDDSSETGDRKLYGYGPSFPLGMCVPYVEFKNRYACVPKKSACTAEEIATIITTSTVTMAEIPALYDYGYDEDTAEGETSNDPKRKMAANKKASKYQPKKQQQKKNAENDVSSDFKRKLEHPEPEPVSLFSKCTDVPTVTKVAKSGKSGKASKAPKSPNLRNHK